MGGDKPPGTSQGLASCPEPLFLAGTPAPTGAHREGPLGLTPSAPHPVDLLRAGEKTAPPECPHVPGGCLSSAQLWWPQGWPRLMVTWHCCPHSAPTGLAALRTQVRPEDELGSSGLAGERGAGGTEGVGTHGGNASFLVVAHAPIHSAHNEDVFRLCLTVKQGRGGNFTCRRDGE